MTFSTIVPTPKRDFDIMQNLYNNTEHKIKDIENQTEYDIERLRAEVEEARTKYKERKTHLEELKDLQRHLWKFNDNERTIARLTERLNRPDPTAEKPVDIYYELELMK